MSSSASAPAQEKNLGVLGTAYRRFQLASAGLQSPLLLLIRLYWGWQFSQSGWGRLHHLSNATDFFTSLHIPFPGATVIFVSVLEFIGGILFILGLGTRLVGFLLSVDMIVAYFTASLDALAAIISDPGKFYGADPFTFLAASLILFTFGPGRFSLDYWFFRRCDC
jgi:putative oxidoreductase